MINPKQIEEWIKEVEERPGSAPLIIQYISGRLRDLTQRNEDLLAENIALRSGQKVEDFENKIASLEYQLELIKRQLQGVDPSALSTQTQNTVCAVFYHPKGFLFRLDLSRSEKAEGEQIGFIQDPLFEGNPPRMLVTSVFEELLMIYDSGRTEALPVSQIPAVDRVRNLSWNNAYVVETRGAEELSSILPIGKMSLYDYCVQISRRGCAKKMMKTSFESHVGKNFIGAGVKAKTDKTCSLAFCSKGSQVFLVSREGFLLTIDVEKLPFTIEEILKLGVTDFIAAVSPLKDEPSIFIITNNGKAIDRETSWLEKANTFKTRGQAAYSQSRRDSGVKIVHASPITKDEWGIALFQTGEIRLYQIRQILDHGGLPGFSASQEILDFAVFSVPDEK